MGPAVSVSNVVALAPRAPRVPRVRRVAATLASVRLRAVEAHALGGRARDVTEAVRRAAGFYGAGPTAHLGLLARTRRYAPRMLDEAVGGSRALVRVHAMRGSVFLVPRDWVPHALVLAQNGAAEHDLWMAGVSERGFGALAGRIERIVAERPRTLSEIRSALGPLAPEGTALTLLLARLAREGRVVRGAARGLRAQSFEYASAREWLGLRGVPPSRDEAVRALAARWLDANGPATAADLAWWAGLSLREARQALVDLGAHIIRIVGIDGELFTTEAILARLGRVAEDDVVHLLPCWDPFVMAHRDRARYLDSRRQPQVVDRAGNVTSVMLRAGRVVGVWDVDGARLLVAPFEPIPEHRLESAAARLAPLHRIDQVVTVADPPSLAEGGPNRFLAPLRPRRDGRG